MAAHRGGGSGRLKRNNVEYSHHYGLAASGMQPYHAILQKFFFQSLFRIVSWLNPEGDSHVRHRPQQ
jgi:hypothetical protein